MGKIVRIVVGLFILVGIAACTDSNSDSDSNQADEFVMPEFEILESWDVAEGQGHALLIENPLDQEGYETFVRTYVAENDPSVLQIFTTQEAYEATHNDRQDLDFRAGFILMFMKEMGEIMWMQEEGPLAHLSGTVTEL